MTRSYVLLIVAALAACGAPTAPSAPQAGLIGGTLLPVSYRAIDLGLLDSTAGSVAEALDVNDLEQIVGWTRAGFVGPSHAFLWQHGVMTDIGTLGGSTSYGLFINRNGQIAGWSTTAAAEQHAFFWQAGVMTDVGTLGGANSYPNAFSEDGAIVGYSRDAAGATHAFLWRDGVLQDLGTLGGSFSVAAAINANGQVVGQSATASGENHAFLWDGVELRDLGTLGGSYSSARGINDAGAITGQSTDSAGVFHAFVWQDGVMRQLADLPGSTSNDGQRIAGSGTVAGGATAGTSRGVVWTGAGAQDMGVLYPGTPITFVTAINGHDQVAGWSVIDPTLVRHAILWENGELRDLGTLDNQLASSANALNARGDVVGWSSGSGTGSLDTRHAVLWLRVTSVPVACHLLVC